MKALSLTQPWGWIILNLGKRVENRTSNIGNYRGPLLLHAAKRMTKADYWRAFEFTENAFGVDVANRIPPSDKLERGCFIGRCRVVSRIGPSATLEEFKEAISLVSGAGCNPSWGAQLPWYMHEYGYILSEVEPVPSVDCAGALGFWNVPEATLELINELEKMKAFTRGIQFALGTAPGSGDK